MTERKKTGGKREGSGRKKLEIDLEQAEKLGSLMATLSECAAWFGLHKGTLSKRPDFMSAWETGKEKGKLSLRRTQFKLAEKSAAMSIWLGKQYLDQVDKQELEHSGDLKINWIEKKTYDTDKKTN